MESPKEPKPIALETYEAIAELYAELVETKAENAYYEQPATLSLMPDVAGKRVLDAGCGPGILCGWLVAQGAEVIAVDVSPKMIELATRRLGAKVKIRLADLSHPLDFLENESFDVVVGSLVFDYIQNWESLFTEFNRILSEDGLLIFSIGHPFNDFLVADTDNYFATEVVLKNWPSMGAQVPCYRRPLQALFSALSGAGFVLDKFLEPLPTEECRRTDPKVYETLSKQPEFLCIRAMKG